MAKEDDIFGLPGWVTTDHEGLSVTVWALSLVALALIFVFVWRWSGTALSPAADIDMKYVGEPSTNETSSNGAEDRKSSSDEIMRAAHRDIDNALRHDLLERILSRGASNAVAVCVCRLPVASQI